MGCKYLLQTLINSVKQAYLLINTITMATIMRYINSGLIFGFVLTILISIKHNEWCEVELFQLVPSFRV